MQACQSLPARPLDRSLQCCRGRCPNCLLPDPPQSTPSACASCCSLRNERWRWSWPCCATTARCGQNKTEQNSVLCVALNRCVVGSTALMLETKACCLHLRTWQWRCCATAARCACTASCCSRATATCCSRATATCLLLTGYRRLLFTGPLAFHWQAQLGPLAYRCQAQLAGSGRPIGAPRSGGDGSCLPAHRAVKCFRSRQPNCATHLLPQAATVQRPPHAACRRRP